MNPEKESHAHLYFCIGRKLMIGNQMPSEMHTDAGIKITVSLEHPFSVSIEKEDWVKTRAVIINTNVPLLLKDLQGLQVTMTIVPERRWGQYLKKFILKGSKIKYLDDLDFSTLIAQFQEIMKGDYDSPAAFRVGEQLIDRITGFRSYIDKMDDRIVQALDRIQKSLSEPISADVLAQSVYLSKHRFLHLFKEQMGLPLRPYILHQRIMKATQEFLQGKSLTEAAHKAVFSDSAHFTRTFIETNGMKPSGVAKLKEIFRVRSCESLCHTCNPQITEF